MGRLRTFCVALSLATTSCSPYYSFLPKALTYEMAEVKPVDSVPPDVALITATELATIAPALIEPKAVEVAAPRKTNRGWAFCLAATINTQAGVRRTVLWVTVISQGIYDRRPAVPADQCELEQYRLIG